MITIRRSLPAAAAVALVLASCGGSDEGADDTAVPTTAAEVDAAADDTEDFSEAESDDTAAEPDDGADDAAAEDEPADAEPAEEEPAEEEPAEDEPADTEPAEAAEEEPADEEEGEPDAGEAAGGAVDVALTEWTIDAPTEYAAGEVAFNTTNSGSFPHELVVIQGESYESLPLAEGGAVIEEDLPTGALIGRLDRLGGGETGTLEVDLAPGNYVLVCNLGGGGNSHAGQGQRLDITVS